MINHKILSACAFSSISLCSLASCSYDFTFGTKELAKGKIGVEYNDSISNGVPDMYYDLDYESSLPSGLLLLDTGEIIGTPLEAGTFEFTCVCIDLNNNEKSADFTLEIEGGEIEYSSKSLPEGKTGDPYLESVATATGMDKITYSLKENETLPKGLTLSSEGTISGIPEEAVSERSFIVVAKANGCDDKEATFTLTIKEGENGNENLGYVVYEDIVLEEGLVGQEYNQSIRKAYGVPNIKYSFRFSSGNGLPSGLKYDKELGIIYGTPLDSTNGTIKFKVTASSEGYKSVQINVTLEVKDVYKATSRLEAEYIYVDKLSGAGYSSAPSGKGMIQKCANASNGFSLGYLNKAVTFDFKFTSKEATSAKLSLGLGSENGSFVYDQEMFKVLVNGTEVNYGTISVKGEGSAESNYAFYPYELSPSVDLLEGDNIITIKILESDKAIGTFSAVGCLFDYIDVLNAKGEIGYRPKVANISNK